MEVSASLKGSKHFRTSNCTITPVLYAFLLKLAHKALQIPDTSRLNDRLSLLKSWNYIMKYGTILHWSIVHYHSHVNMRTKVLWHGLTFKYDIVPKFIPHLYLYPQCSLLHLHLPVLGKCNFKSSIYTNITMKLFKWCISHEILSRCPWKLHVLASILLSFHNN